MHFVRNRKYFSAAVVLSALLIAGSSGAAAQRPDRGQREGGPERGQRERDQRGGFGRGGFGRGGRAGGPNAPDRKILKEFDQDKDGVLNAAERKLARAELERDGGNRRRRGPGRRQMEPGKPGPKVSPDDVKSFPDAGLYDQSVLRTLFLDFEMEDWESELALFKPTDVEIPATLTVDGQTYPNVGVSFRGASSFFMIPAGLKRSLNLSLDFIDQDQRLYGYKSLNLLNCNGDPSMMSSILYSHLSGLKIPTPKVNYVKVVINGESWGVYVSSQQFNKTFIQENFGTKKGARWKVSGSPQGDGGLRYLGEDIEPYRQRFEIKSRDQDESWRELIKLCRVLNETPAEDLKAALSEILDIDGALWFLAVDVASCNSDGYWTRASDYNIYQDESGKFHILPHDMNEAFRVRGGPGGPPGGFGGPGGPGGFGPPRFGPPGGGPRGFGPPGGIEGPPARGPGFRPDADGTPAAQEGRRRGEPGQGGRPGDLRGGRNDGGRGGRGGQRQRGFGRGGFRGRGGPGHGGIDLDPLVGLDQERMPLRSVLLSQPEWQAQYLANLAEIAELMKWENIGPRVMQYRDLIQDEVKLDTRKLFSTEAFQQATADGNSGEESTGLRSFLEKRSAFLLKHEKIQAAARKR